MIEILKQIDTNIYLAINGVHATFADKLMWWISGFILWLPLYAFIIIYAIKKYGNKCFLIIPLFFLVFGITDEASHLIKILVERYRPSHNLKLENIVHIVNNYRGGMYGFPSSHAANTFGVTTIVVLIFRNIYFTRYLFLWPLIVSYSRIYLGVHYPSDIFCGAILGISIGCLMYMLYKLLYRKIWSNGSISVN